MLIKLNEQSYISKNAIHQICLKADDEKYVAIYGHNFKLQIKCKTKKEAITWLSDIVDRVNDCTTDLSMYNWETFV